MIFLGQNMNIYFLFFIFKFYSRYSINFYILDASYTHDPQIYTGASDNFMYSNPSSSTSRPQLLDHTLCAQYSGQMLDVTMLFSCERPVQARYVIIELWKPSRTHIILQEIEVHGTC